MKVRPVQFVALASLVLLAAAGCSKPDPTLEAAPPPGANARPETGGGVKKNMPTMGGPNSMSGPAKQP